MESFGNQTIVLNGHYNIRLETWCLWSFLPTNCAHPKTQWLHHHSVCQNKSTIQIHHLPDIKKRILISFLWHTYVNFFLAADLNHNMGGCVFFYIFLLFSFVSKHFFSCSGPSWIIVKGRKWVKCWAKYRKKGGHLLCYLTAITRKGYHLWTTQQRIHTNKWEHFLQELYNNIWHVYSTFHL